MTDVIWIAIIWIDSRTKTFIRCETINRMVRINQCDGMANVRDEVLSWQESHEKTMEGISTRNIIEK